MDALIVGLLGLAALYLVQGRIMAALDAITAEVERTKGVAESAVVLIKALADKIEQAGTDPAKLEALTAELRASSDSLAAAVDANDGEPEPAPPTE